MTDETKQLSDLMKDLFSALNDKIEASNQELKSEIKDIKNEMKDMKMDIAQIKTTIDILDSLSGEARIVKRLSEEVRIEAEEKGLKEGRQEEKYEIAKNMLKENLPIDLIVKVTGMSTGEIKELEAMV